MYIHRSTIYSFLCFLRNFSAIDQFFRPSRNFSFYESILNEHVPSCSSSSTSSFLFIRLPLSLFLFSEHSGRALNRIKDKASAVATTRHDNGEQWDGIWSVSYSNLFATKGHSLRWRSRTERKRFDRPPEIVRPLSSLNWEIRGNR